MPGALRSVRFEGAGRQVLAIASLFVAATGLVACTTPAQKADAIAREAGLEREVVAGAGFNHVVYRGRAAASSGVLHVYIEGDGRAYLDRWTVAPDPTPTSPVMLRLMATDRAPSLYVGRPCYFGLAGEAGCNPFFWTLGRFSQPVIDSMTAAIANEARDAGAIELYGHSGGGALAVLLARRLDKVTRVVTLAGNLDPAAWSQLHDYSPLSGSESPLSGGPLHERIAQTHYAGSRDRNVPPALLAEAVPRLGAGRLVVVAEADHTCCWGSVWPAVLAAGADAVPQRN